MGILESRRDDTAREGSRFLALGGGSRPPVTSTPGACPVPLPPSWGSSRNNHSILRADASRLAALLLLDVAQPRLRRRALPDGRLDAHLWSSCWVTSPSSRCGPPGLDATGLVHSLDARAWLSGTATAKPQSRPRLAADHPHRDDQSLQPAVSPLRHGRARVPGGGAPRGDVRAHPAVPPALPAAGPAQRAQRAPHASPLPRDVRGRRRGRLPGGVAERTAAPRAGADPGALRDRGRALRLCCPVAGRRRAGALRGDPPAG